MSHERISRMNSQDNRLMVSGRALSDYLQGSSKPHYIYSKAEIADRISALRSALPAAIKLHYAMKANPNSDVLRYVAGLVDGLDVASVGEMQQAITTGATHISFAGPAKQEHELAAAINAGVIINVESPTELQRIQQLAKKSQQTAKIALRVNPDFELKQSGMQMAGGAKPFGIDAENIPAVMQTIDTSCAKLVGFHIFSGSQNLDAQAIINAHEQTFNLAQSLINEAQAQGLGDAVEHVNIGGGFGIPYFSGQTALEVAPIAASLSALLAGRTGVFAKANIVMELGRYIVGEAGYYVCQITDIKASRGTKYLMVNGGLHHHLSNSGNFGQVIRKNYPTVLADKISVEPLEKVEIAGPLCTPLDIVAAKISLPIAEIGDYVVVLQSGAYGFSASPLGFLGHEPPVELLV